MSLDAARPPVAAREQTPQEARLWVQLRRRRLAGRKFHRQYVLGSSIVDFVCLEERLIVEVDGGQHDANAAKDAARTAWLQSQGFRELRFWNTEVEQNLEGDRDHLPGVCGSGSAVMSL